MSRSRTDRKRLACTLAASALLATLAATALLAFLPASAPPASASGRPERAAHPSALQGGAADLVWSTFLGGAQAEDDYALAVDAAGVVYMGGETASPNLATGGAAFPRLAGAQDGFIAGLTPAGDGLAFLTYLGGGAHDVVTDIVVDRDGSILVAGYTASADFPVTAGAYDARFGGQNDAFVARLDPTGARLLAATFLGGASNDYAETVRLDDAGNVYVSGETWSADMQATAGAFQTALAGASDMFVVRLDAGLAQAGYATFVGGRGDDCADCSMDVAGDGRATLVGKTNSTDMPVTAGAYDTTANGGYDAFVGRLVADGSALEYGTYLGGRGTECEEGCYVAVDGDGSTLLVGNTTSPDFPVSPGAPGQAGAGRDAVVARLSADGSQLAFSRRLAGSGTDVPRDVDIAADGSVLVVARTDSADFPVTADGFDPSYNGSGDVAAVRAFVAGLRIEPGEDRVALVAFNERAWTLTALTHEARALEAALGGIEIRPQTRIDLGIARAAELLAEPRPDAERAMIVLSDGLANPVPSEAVVQAADAARARAIQLFAVGFGQQLDEPLLRRVAGDAGRYYPAASAGALAHVFDQLTVRVPCSPTAYWPVRRRE